MRIYVASSWRNEHQPAVVNLLRSIGHEVYDFRNPSTEGPAGAPSAGFSWAEIDPAWERWTTHQYRSHLYTHPAAKRGFHADMAALEWADVTLLVQPCGRSAHLELGWSSGAGRLTAIYFPTGQSVEPELMALVAQKMLIGRAELIAWAQDLPPGRLPR